MLNFRSFWRKAYDADEQITNEQIKKATAWATILDEKYPVKIEDYSKLKVDSSYEGPHIKENGIDQEFVEQLIELYTKHAEENDAKKNILHKKYAYTIITQTTALLLTERAFNDLEVPKKGSLTIIGDTHGQLLDILTILKLQGFPSNDNIYLFNGDFVDRGPHSVEVLLLLYSLKLLNPKSIYLNRGNHENRRMNARYGFEDQVADRYNQSIYELIQRSFITLPLGCIINEKIVVVHGGLFPHKDVTLDELRKMNYRKELAHSTSGREEEIMEGILWSDPREEELENGYQPSTRGAGWHFNEKITDRFLKSTGVKLVIRSHECKQEGFQYSHNKKIITIFSASYYSLKEDNKGAFIVLSGEKFYDSLNSPDFPDSFIFEQFYASAYAILFNNIEESDERIKTQTLNQIRSQIFQLRHDLFFAFQKYRYGDSNHILLEDWEKVLKRLLKVDIPFIALLPYLFNPKSSNPPPSGYINFVAFLSSFKLTSTSKALSSWCKKMTRKIGTEFYNSNENIEKIFKEADTSGDGELNYEEFMAVIKKLNLKLNDKQIYDLMMKVDKNHDGAIQYSEFLSEFQISSRDKKKTFEANQLISELVKRIHKKYKKYTLKKAVRVLFKEIDIDDSGTLTYDEFIKGLVVALRLDFSTKQLTGLVEFFDTNASGKISYSEFKRALLPFEENENVQSAGQQLLDYFYANSLNFKSFFRRLDLDNSGYIDREEFINGLSLINASLEHPLSKKEISSLFDFLDSDGSGKLDYNEFTSNLKVIQDGIETN